MYVTAQHENRVQKATEEPKDGTESSLSSKKPDSATWSIYPRSKPEFTREEGGDLHDNGKALLSSAWYVRDVRARSDSKFVHSTLFSQCLVNRDL